MRFMKNIIVLFTLWMVVLLSSCTHNDGDIGPLFGQWKLVSIEKSGRKDTYDNLFLSFQSFVIEFKTVTYPHSYSCSYGDYEHVGNYLNVTVKEGGESILSDFQLNKNNEDEWRFSFNVMKLTNHKMILSLDDKIYTFTKYGN